MEGITGVEVGEAMTATVGDSVGSNVCVAAGEKTGTAIAVLCGGVRVTMTVRV